MTIEQPDTHPFSHIEDARLRKMAEDHFGLLRQMIESSEEQIIPILLLEVGDDVVGPDREVIPKGSLVPVGIADDITRDRELAYIMLARLIRQLRAVRAVWGGEAWMAQAGPGGELPQLPLAEHPERVDCLIIIAFNADDAHGFVFPILHTDDGRRVQTAVAMPGGEWSGLMTDFLQPALLRP